MDKLISSPESQSKMYLEKLENCLEIEGFNGIIPIDHLFSLLEGEFERQDIEEVIYNELRVKDSDKLESHQTILKLATTSEEKVQLVTTNFDKLSSFTTLFQFEHLN
ncbi:hypothetical protein [uncultured Gammaproteobacteria bacterium]|nr:hypothetical protein [uncultured Gammaproteobacteria bacterium]